VAEEYRGASEERHPVEQKTTYTIIKNTGIEMYPSEKTEGTTEPIEKSIAEIEKKGERKITTMRCWTRLK
jgi:predicted secreted Zn-dependent protease